MATGQSTSVPANVKNITGQRFTRLVVESYSHMHDGNSYWRCACDCGRTTTVAATNLKNKRRPVKSCGCLQTEVRRSRKTQGAVLTCDRRVNEQAEYSCWRAMITRCHCQTTPTYEQYGARGITVCDRWRRSFVAFLEDVGPRPSPGHTLDRYPDQNGNYEPGNVRWATQQEQQRNRTNNRMLTHDGVTLCLAEWAERAGMKPTTLMGRLKRGLSLADAMARPLRVWPGPITRAQS